MLNWLLQVLLAVEHLHTRGIIHRAIVPHNLFLNRVGDLKLGHFRIAKELGPSGMTTTFVPQDFPSPEMLERPSYGPKADVWAIGCLIF